MTKQILLSNEQWENTVRRTYRTLIAPSIAFKPAFADLTGSVTAALMLSQAYYWSDGRTTQEDGWFYKTADEWEKELRLSYFEQTTARKRLSAIYLVSPDEDEIPIWEEKVKGVPGTLHFHINDVALALALTIMENNGYPVGGYSLVAPNCLVNIAHDRGNRDSSIEESAELDTRKPRSSLYTESTTKITTETDHVPTQGKGTNVAGGKGDKPKPFAMGDPGYAKPGSGTDAAKYAAQAQTLEYAAKAKGYGLDQASWIAYYNRLAEICGITRLVTTNDYELNKLRERALMLISMELPTLDALNAMASLWASENTWRAGTKPTLDWLTRFQSQKLEEISEKAAKAVAMEDNPKIEVERRVVDTDGNKLWIPTTMRRKQFEKEKAEGVAIRLAETD